MATVNVTTHVEIAYPISTQWGEKLHSIYNVDVYILYFINMSWND